MSFKAGDRVEVLPGPPNVDRPEAVGPGTIIDIYYHRPTGETFYVQPDKGDSWYYSEDQLRPLTVHINPQTPTPSVKVGDQVRLTGVVRRIEEASGGGNLRGMCHRNAGSLEQGPEKFVFHLRRGTLN